MLLIDLPRGRVGLAFKHRKYDKPTLNSDICKRFMNGFTKCEIFTLDGRDALRLCDGIGIAKFPDTFCKALGRKRSLTSALRQKIGTAPVFSKSERELIWQAYWKMIEPQAAPQFTEDQTAHDTATGEGMPEPKSDISGVPMQE